jgi:hypothetical protein
MKQALDRVFISSLTPNLHSSLEAPPPADGKERELYDDAAHVLANSQTVLDKLLNYTGCEDVIRKAITTPGAETEQVRV